MRCADGNNTNDVTMPRELAAEYANSLEPTWTAIKRKENTQDGPSLDIAAAIYEFDSVRLDSTWQFS